jgi:hypothetical protein
MFGRELISSALATAGPARMSLIESPVPSGFDLPEILRASAVRYFPTTSRKNGSKQRSQSRERI